MLNRQFIIKPANKKMSELDKQANYHLQILQQCAGDFRTISQHSFPALIMIGNQDSKIITKHIEMLASFLGQSNQLVIKSVLRGFAKMIPINPAFHSLIEQKARLQIEKLLNNISGIADNDWQEVSRLAEATIVKLDGSPIKLSNQVHVSPNKPYDHFEEFAKRLNIAKNDIYYVDPYLGDDIVSFLVFLRKSDGSNKKLRLLTRKDPSVDIALRTALSNFKNQGNEVELRYDEKMIFHDRWLMLDAVSIYKIGASLKGLAKAKSKKSFGIEKLDEPACSLAKNDLEQWWTDGTKIL